MDWIKVPPMAHGLVKPDEKGTDQIDEISEQNEQDSDEGFEQFDNEIGTIFFRKTHDKFNATKHLKYDAGNLLARAMKDYASEIFKKGWEIVTERDKENGDRFLDLNSFIEATYIIDQRDQRRGYIWNLFNKEKPSQGTHGNVLDKLTNYFNSDENCSPASEEYPLGVAVRKSSDTTILAKDSERDYALLLKLFIRANVWKN